MVLLLNMPPDGRGLIHENDTEALKGFRKLLDSTFEHDLAKGAKVYASNTRSKSSKFDVMNMINDDKDS